MASGYTSPYSKDSKPTKSKYIIKVKKLSDKAKLPTKAYKDDTGWDLYSSEQVTIPPNSVKLISTGIAVELPDNYWAKIFDRSGNALKRGFIILAGVIDNGYRGEIKVVCLNYTSDPIFISEGDKIAQMVLFKTYYSEVEEVSFLSDTDRSTKGFGSSKNK